MNSEPTYGRSLVVLLVSWALSSTLVVLLTFIGYVIGTESGPSVALLRSSIRWMPGVSTGPIVGALGGLFYGLVELYRAIDEAHKRTFDPIRCALSPFAGLIAGLFVFLVFVCTGAFRIADGTPIADTFAVLNDLRPSSAIQMGVYFLSSFAVGYYFRDLPDVLRAIRDRVFQQTTRRS